MDFRYKKKKGRKLGMILTYWLDFSSWGFKVHIQNFEMENTSENRQHCYMLCVLLKEGSPFSFKVG